MLGANDIFALSSLAMPRLSNSMTQYPTGKCCLRLMRWRHPIYTTLATAREAVLIGPLTESHGIADLPRVQPGSTSHLNVIVTRCRNTPEINI